MWKGIIKTHTIARQSAWEFNTELDKYLNNWWCLSQDIYPMNDCFIAHLDKIIIPM